MFGLQCERSHFRPLWRDKLRIAVDFNAGLVNKFAHNHALPTIRVLQTTYRTVFRQRRQLHSSRFTIAIVEQQSQLTDAIPVRTEHVRIGRRVRFVGTVVIGRLARTVVHSVLVHSFADFEADKRHVAQLAGSHVHDFSVSALLQLWWFRWNSFFLKKEIKNKNKTF